MLANKSSSAIVAVRDLDQGRRFYEGILGLAVDGDATEEVLTFKTGDTRLVVYRSEEAGTNTANAVVWGVGDDLEIITSDLGAKGVVFERYDIPDATYQNGVHAIGDFRMVWFKDPDGNILHLNSAT